MIGPPLAWSLGRLEDQVDRKIKKKGTRRSTRPAPTCPRNGRLLQRVRDRFEVRRQLGAETVHGGDDRNRDTRCNQAILNGRGS